MKIKVYLTGDSDKTALRLVDVPTSEYESLQLFGESSDRDRERFYSLVFKYGQNDFQPVAGVRSLMVGDLIELDGSYHLIQSFGFKTLTEAEMDEYMALSPDNRRWSSFCRPNMSKIRGGE